MDKKIIEVVKDWFNKTEDWQKDAFINLWKSKDLEDVKVRSLKLIYKEWGFLDSKYTCDTTFPEDLNDDTLDNSQTMLKSISEVQGVAALNPTKPLEFKEGLNVVYGANGCGKSSYVKVLKKAENPKDKTKIHPNIFKDDITTTKATITFSEDGEDRIIHWTLNNQKVMPIRIYDTKVAQRFVEESNRTVYEPKLLNVFTLLGEVIDYVSGEVSNEYKNKETSIKSFPDDIKNSTLCTRFNKLESDNEIDDFEKEVIFSKSDEKELKTLEKVFADLNPVTTKTKLLKQIDILEKLKEQISDLYVELDKSRVDIYLKARNKQIETRRAFESFLISSRNCSNIKEFGNDEWKELWEAAEKFSETIVNNKNDICVLCQQPLSQEAKERIKKFSEIYSSDLERAQRVAQEDFTKKVEDLGIVIRDKLNINDTKQLLITNAFDEEFVLFIESILELLLRRANWLYNYEDNSPACPEIGTSEDVIKHISNQVTNRKEEINALVDYIENY